MKIIIVLQTLSESNDSFENLNTILCWLNESIFSHGDKCCSIKLKSDLGVKTM